MRKDFSPLHVVQTGSWGPPSLLPDGYWGLFPQGVKQLEHEDNHSPSTNAEVKKTWIYIHSSIPLQSINFRSFKITNFVKTAQ
jgi:hypothetical protein